MNQTGKHGADDGLGFSVVVPTYNHAGPLRGALDSMANQTIGRDRFEVVVVDDGSSDETASVVAYWTDAHPEVALHFIQQLNGGVNAARNAGIRAAQGAVIVLLDADERAPVDYLSRVEQLLMDESIPGVGGPAVGVDVGHLATCNACGVADASVDFDSNGSTGRLLGGNMAVRRRIFDDVGLFDEELSGRGDEVEWFARAALMFHYEPTLVVFHTREGRSLRDLVGAAYRQGASIPLATSRAGGRWRPRPATVMRFIGHTVVRRCGNGLVLAAREVGAWRGCVTARRRGQL